MVRKAKKKTKPSEITEAEQPFNLVSTALLKKGKILKFSEEEIPWHAFSKEPFGRKEVEETEERLPQEKIHHVLKKWIS